MSKAVILFFYGLTVTITLRAWYAQGNSGLPDAAILAPSAYLFGILALSADFLEGLPVVLAVALTVVLWERNNAATSTKLNMAKG